MGFVFGLIIKNGAEFLTETAPRGRRESEKEEEGGEGRRIEGAGKVKEEKGKRNGEREGEGARERGEWEGQSWGALKRSGV